MNVFPQGEAQWNRAGMRILAVCLGLCAVVFFWTGYLADLHQVYGLPWGMLHDWQVMSLWAATFLAAIMILWSLVLLLGELRYRDLRYGFAGVCVGLASLALWLLLSNTAPR